MLEDSSQRVFLDLRAVHCQYASHRVGEGLGPARTSVHHVAIFSVSALVPGTWQETNTCRINTNINASIYLSIFVPPPNCGTVSYLFLPMLYAEPTFS